jgi:hypothetical protein
MTDEAMSPLRRRMIEDMTIRKFAPKTQHDYLQRSWRKAHAGRVSLGQLKVMSAIENCRTAALGGHVARCEKCSHTQIAYNSCRNRHCPKCQDAAAKQWLAEREAELLPVPYYHMVFTVPAPISDIAYQNKAVIYDILFKASAEALMTIAVDPKHLGARVGITSVLHTWGSAMTHHPHVHMIVPGGGISLDGKRWVSCRPGFFLPAGVTHQAGMRNPSHHRTKQRVGAEVGFTRQRRRSRQRTYLNAMQSFETHAVLAATRPDMRLSRGSPVLRA